jgi:GNAT superfamily N-acetyltransferase
MMIGLAKTEREIAACFETMRDLRTHLVEDEFVAQVKAMMAEGYRLAFIEEEGRVVCVAGFRVSTNFFLGKHLYVEHLSTAEESRSAGHGARMMAWLRERARAEGCAALNLDSGVQRHRAHRFYFDQGMQIACHHFLEYLAQFRDGQNG